MTLKYLKPSLFDLIGILLSKLITCHPILISSCFRQRKAVFYLLELGINTKNKMKIYGKRRKANLMQYRFQATKKRFHLLNQRQFYRFDLQEIFPMSNFRNFAINNTIQFSLNNISPKKRFSMKIFTELG